VEDLWAVLAAIAALGLVALASREVGGWFRRAGLPLISGFLICGVLAGPDLLGLLSRAAVDRLRFVDQLAIACIGFIAGGELYLKEFRDRIRPILWVTLGIAATAVPLVVIAFGRLSAAVPDIAGAGAATVLAASLLVGSILVAISPSSSVAVIKELRAWGPFTRLALGVTVIMDGVVIVLFAVSAELSDVILHGGGELVGTVFFLIVELGLSVAIAAAVGLLLRLILGRVEDGATRSGLVLFVGWAVFALARLLRQGGVMLAGHEVLLEPLLICMVAGLFVANATPYRGAFHRLLDRSSAPVFLVFFTLAGASMSLQVLARSWQVALALFGVRLGAIVVGAFLGGLIAGEPVRQGRLLWMSFVTQAGVGLSLAKQVALEFSAWGQSLATIIIAVIVLNQLIGPPLFRWVLKVVREAHPRAHAAGFDGVRDVIVFGHEGQALALARQLHEQGWHVKLAAIEGAQFEDLGERGLEIHPVDEISAEALERLDAARAECIVSLLDDDANFRVCELAYERFGTDNLVVRAPELRDHQRFHELGVVVVDPSTAMISLLDHLVRSPRSTSLLLGLEAGRDVAEVQLGNPNLHEVPLRELVLPEDALVLSLRRGTNTLITHGDTRLRLDDWLTVLGSHDSLEEVAVRFAGEARAG
jgi:Trk K+ transport system NAD-binding subunit/Kef-type K+ transport system membrane component KefB